jgi:threonyl-tRNA synthetase
MLPTSPGDGKKKKERKKKARERTERGKRELGELILSFFFNIFFFHPSGVTVRMQACGLLCFEDESAYDGAGVVPTA